MQSTFKKKYLPVRTHRAMFSDFGWLVSTPLWTTGFARDRPSVPRKQNLAAPLRGEYLNPIAAFDS